MWVRCGVSTGPELFLKNLLCVVPVLVPVCRRVVSTLVGDFLLSMVRIPPVIDPVAIPLPVTVVSTLLALPNDSLLSMCVSVPVECGAETLQLCPCSLWLSLLWFVLVLLDPADVVKHPWTPECVEGAVMTPT